MRHILTIFFLISLHASGQLRSPDQLVPLGGTTGQFLKKVSNGDWDITWATLAGGGDMLTTNNLSDLTNASTARTNLGVNTTANISNSTNKNFVTDAHLTILGNTSGTNTGDNAVNSTSQPVDADLTTISGLTATTDNFLVGVSSAWASRTPAQVKTTLAINLVENTALSTWVGTSNVTTLGTVGTGVWQGGVINSTYGGTGINNAGRTLTINTNSGTLAFSASGKTMTFGNSVTVNGTDATTITLPAVTSTLLPNTTTSGVAATATASGTTTVTHNLGRIPTTIRIKSISSFTANAAAVPVPFSMGTWNSTGNRCLYMVINGTSTQVSQTSTVFSVIMVTSAGNSISGVIGNVTSTGFDIVWTETGTHTAGNYLWEAQ